MNTLVQELLMLNIVLGLSEEEEESKWLSAFRLFLVVTTLLLAIGNLCVNIKEIYERRKGIE